MKPPSRCRTEPSRFRLKRTEEDQALIVRSVCLGWTRKEQQDFLQCLKQQQNFESELDVTVLQKKVPNRPLKEVGLFLPLRISLMVISVDFFCDV